MSKARPTAREIYFSGDRPFSRSAQEQEEIEKRFFARVRLQNKVFKTTYSRRLDDVNAALYRLLPREMPIEVMDVAISSGISTQEWVTSLTDAGFDFRMVAGDLNIHAFLISFSKHLEILVDRSGYPIHFDLFGQGLELSLIKFIPRPLSFRLKQSLAQWLRQDAVLAACMQGARAANLQRHDSRCVPITLVSPRLTAHPRLEIIEDDILANQSARLANRFHAIRAANILNRSYFGKAELRSILMNLRQRLRPAGLLVVCRTLKNNQTNGTVFSLNQNGTFQVAARIGEGSEIEEDVLSLYPMESCADYRAIA